MHELSDTMNTPLLQCALVSHRATDWVTGHNDITLRLTLQARLSSQGSIKEGSSVLDLQLAC